MTAKKLTVHKLKTDLRYKLREIDYRLILLTIIVFTNRRQSGNCSGYMKKLDLFPEVSCKFLTYVFSEMYNCVYLHGICIY